MEWTVVTVIIAIVGLIGTVAVPLGKNTKAMTQLAEQINHLNFRITDDEKDFNDYKQKASQRHENEPHNNIQPSEIVAFWKRVK